MSLDVGRITARIEADVKQFEQNMNGAQKTFESVSVKMEASATKASATVQKTLRERILAANGAAAIEIEAARRTMRERLKFASSTSEITAVKRAYQERGAAARAAADKEIAALKSVSGTASIVPVLEQVTKASARAAPGVNSVRSAMTALAASSLSTAPGVAQVSSVLSAMALGAPATIAILAGITAITLAFRKLTKAGDELIENGDRARKSIIETSKTQVERAKEAVKALKDENAELEKRAGLWAQGAALAGAVLPRLMGIQVAGFAAGKAGAFSKTITENQSAEILGNKLVTKEMEEEIAERLRKQEAAAEKLRRIFEKNAEDYARAWERAHLRVTAFEIRQRTRLQGAGAIDISGGGPGNNASRLLPDDIKQAIIAGMAAAARGAGGSGPGDSPAKGKSFLDLVKGKFDFKAIASGVLTGGISSAINLGLGTLTSFADGLFDFSGKAKAAAAAMKKAQEEWSKNLDRFILEHTGTDAQKSAADALDQVDEWLAGFEERFNKGAKLKRPDFKSLDAVLEWAQALLESSLSVDPARAKEFAKFIEAIRVLQGELGKTADAAKNAVSQLTNVPNGFKIALARFNATAGALHLAPFIPSGPRGSFPVAPAGGAPRAGTVNNFNGTIEVYGVEDVPSFLEKLEVEIGRKKLRGAASVTLDY